MRAVRLVVATTAMLLAVWGATASTARALPAAQALTRALNNGMGELGRFSGAYVVDLTTGQPLYAMRAGDPRLPASVEKLYTTSVALLDFGPNATFSTQVLATGHAGAGGAWFGTLYLRGGGDPTFGSSAFDRAAYGGGATVQALVAVLKTRLHLRAMHGRIVGDATFLDSRPSTIESGFAFDPYMEGSLSALAFNRGLLAGGEAGVANPPLFAAGQLASALRAAHVRVRRRPRVAAGRTPPTARLVASVASPRMAELIALTNTQSDNFFAETLTKDLGARFGARGTTAAGVSVIRDELAARFGLAPTFNDGSGLSRDDATTPVQVVTLLTDMAPYSTFTNSLAIAGETGTLQHEMVGTPAQGACRGKTGTLRDVAALAGYCHAADGHTLAFAFLANELGDPALGHLIEARMAVAVSRYSG